MQLLGSVLITVLYMDVALDKASGVDDMDSINGGAGGVSDVPVPAGRFNFTRLHVLILWAFPR